jgi:hypothetical protein
MWLTICGVLVGVVALLWVASWILFKRRLKKDWRYGLREHR